MTPETFLALHDAYIVGRQMREAEYAQQAAVYTSLFEAAYRKRMTRMAEDSRVFREVTIPAIKREASLLRYERELASRNSAAVAETR